MSKIPLLIVDDDKALAGALMTKFTALGRYAPTIAENGQEALDALSKKHYAVMLLDLNMPHKTGVDVLKEIKKTKNPDIPSYVITNLGNEDSCEEAMENGAKRCFIKSRVKLSDVVKIVEESTASAA